MTNQLRDLKIEVTYACPLGCIHCSSDADPQNSAQMTKEDCLSIMKSAVELGVESVSFSGGEPLIWPPIYDCIKWAHDHFGSVSIYTTGNVPDIAEAFRSLQEHGLDVAIFSLYAANRANHERITRQCGSYDRTIEAIKACIALGIRSELHFVATSKNYRELEALGKMAVSLGIGKISVLRLVPQGRGALMDGIMSRKQNIEMLKTIKKMRAAGYNLRTGSPMNVFWLNDNPRCLAAKDRLVITPNLDVFPCDAFKQVSIEDIVGTKDGSNLAQSSLRECWGNSPFLNQIRNVLSSEPEEPCRQCKRFANCNTGCLAQKYLACGNLVRGQDPSCLLLKEND